MSKPKIIIILFSMLIVLTVMALPVFALDYNPGVSTGQYVEYGNFVGEGPGFESFNDYDWQKIQIISVTGKDVTLLFTGQFKDGTPTPGNGSTTVWNIEAGTENGNPSIQGPIIAANLNQGDAIPPPNTYTVNNTETRTYLGVSRSVNILNIMLSTPDYNTTLTFIYDKISGMLLEAASETTQGQLQPTTSKYAYSITETNIFDSTSPTPTPTPTPEQSATIPPTTQPTSSPIISPSQSPPQAPDQGIPAEYLIAIGVIIAIIAVVAAILLKKIKK